MSTSASEVKRFLNEGKKLLEKGEVVQASEPVYKVAEDAVKILAKEYAAEVYAEAKHRLGEDVGSAAFKFKRELLLSFCIIKSSSIFLLTSQCF